MRHGYESCRSLPVSLAWIRIDCTNKINSNMIPSPVDSADITWVNAIVFFLLLNVQNTIPNNAHRNLPSDGSFQDIARSARVPGFCKIQKDCISTLGNHTLLHFLSIATHPITWLNKVIIPWSVRLIIGMYELVDEACILTDNLQRWRLKENN